VTDAGLAAQARAEIAEHLRRLVVAGEDSDDGVEL
jgi:hypothetical protein